MYALYLYFLGLSFRNTSKAIQPLFDKEEKKQGVMQLSGNGFRDSILNTFTIVKEYLSAFLIDETMIQIGCYSEAWLWVVVEPIHKQILGVYISRHRNMIVAEVFLNSLIKIYGKYTVYSDGGTWYPEACISLGLKHRLHTSYEKSIVERTIEYLKDRTEAFDDYFPCIGGRTNGLCNLQHVYKWLILFVFMHNNSIIKSNANFINLWR